MHADNTTESPKSGVDLIALERARQTEKEDWTAEHDDSHLKGELAQAASVLASLAAFEQERGALTTGKIYISEQHWPFEKESLKARDGVLRNLVKAGALIAAEIDRLKRLQVQEKPNAG